MSVTHASETRDVPFFVGAAAAEVGAIVAIIALIVFDFPIPGFVAVLSILFVTAGAGLSAGFLARNRHTSADTAKRLAPLVVATASYGLSVLGHTTIVRYSPDESIWRAGWVYLIVGFIVGSLNVIQFLVSRRSRRRASAQPESTG